ncbi:serine/threonine-protein kinase [Herbiconiux ginsengi]|uniref:non-specific serine/threonine protein kinase n=1 Tax=Herbiconiux ginsengi TaxID=381665 RepID=A0A1H3KR26_9MICO|nr:serine/threonine-protein kinase [Herbiconiux ginsengi]SDY54238.1 Serine/threonine protein kinase [Herbiconiux ginsengi]
MTRAPATPPRLAGFDYLQTIGSGGFADVYLYEQHLPRRRVAVKVLATDVFDDRAVEHFRDEANLMAQLSTHPSIVTIHQAGIAETGQPYLVMEYCAQPNFGSRFRAAPIPVTEALAVGVQIAGAVETAHRAGILHRDIKPANILVTDYHRPALADFGIAGTLGAAHAIDALSVPWAAPEVLTDEATLRVSSDVYALGATIYSLLAGRAPFEIPGGDNSAEAMSARIRAGGLPPIGRADVPPAVEEAIAVALSASPSARSTSALAFGRALQRVQEQLGFSVTPIDVTDDAFTRGPSFDDSRSRPITATGSVPATDAVAATVPAAVPPFPTGAPAAPIPPVPTGSHPAAAAFTPSPATASTTPITAPLESTVRRSTAPAPVYTAPVVKKPVWPGIVLDAVLVAAVAAAAAVYLIGG